MEIDKIAFSIQSALNITKELKRLEHNKDVNIKIEMINDALVDAQEELVEVKSQISQLIEQEESRRRLEELRSQGSKKE